MSDLFSAITYIDIIGYFGTSFVLLSFFMKDLKTLRKVSIVGCSFFIFYGFLLHYAIPIIITNVTIIVINTIYLYKSRKV